MRLRFSGKSYTFLVSIGIAFCFVFYLLITTLGYYPPLPGGDDTQFWIYVASGYRESTNVWASLVAFFQADTPNGLHALLFLLGTLKYLVNPILVVILIETNIVIRKIKHFSKIGLAYALLYPTIYFVIGGLYRDPLICTLYLLIFITLCKYSTISGSSLLTKVVYIVILSLFAILTIALRPQILYISIISLLYFSSSLFLRKYLKPKSIVNLAAISTIIGVSYAVTTNKEVLLTLITSFEGTSGDSVFVALINLPWIGGPLYLAANFIYSFLAFNPSKPAYIMVFLFETLPALLTLRVFFNYSSIIFKNRVYLFLVSFIFSNVLILSLSCPNTGSSLRYRYPIFMTTVPFALMLINKNNYQKI